MTNFSLSNSTGTLLGSFLKNSIMKYDYAYGSSIDPRNGPSSFAWNTSSSYMSVLGFSDSSNSIAFGNLSLTTSPLLAYAYPVFVSTQSPLTTAILVNTSSGLYGFLANSATSGLRVSSLLVASLWLSAISVMLQ